MKKAILFMFMHVALTASAQKDVTKFLGIPVDGLKSEMKNKLKAKGFTYDIQNDCFEGEFNGREVNIFIGTNNNKVWRIMVCDKTPCGEGEIKIRFNHLCRQFEKNQKYVALSNYTIPDEEDISYEMIVHNKRYEASYCQYPDTSLIDKSALQNKLQEAILKEYTQEDIANPEKQQEIMEKVIEFSKKETEDLFFELTKKKLVWFMISEMYRMYYITIFYDNEYNHSDGEDL